jgi:hypothetical protein
VKQKPKFREKKKKQKNLEMASTLLLLCTSSVNCQPYINLNYPLALISMSSSSSFAVLHNLINILNVIFLFGNDFRDFAVN